MDFCNELNGKHNAITKVTFEKESKIDEIRYRAFYGNLLTTVTIPGSITSIGDDAFNCDTLTSATIQRAKGKNFQISSTSFGTVTPTYQP